MRKQFDSLRRAGAAGKVDALLLYSRVRLSRDKAECSALLKEFESHGVEIHFVEDQSGD